MGGQGIGVRGVPGTILEGTTTFDGVSFKWDRLEREDSVRVILTSGVLETGRHYVRYSMANLKLKNLSMYL